MSDDLYDRAAAAPPRERVVSLRSRALVRLADDLRVREDVVLVGAARRELGHDRAVCSRLEPVQRVRRDRELLTGPQDDLLVSLDVEVHDAGAAAERLLLAGIVADRWMAVLRTDLAREEHELLRAYPLGVHVGQELQPGLLESAEPEIGHLDRV